MDADGMRKLVITILEEELAKPDSSTGKVLKKVWGVHPPVCTNEPGKLSANVVTAEKLNVNGITADRIAPLDISQNVNRDANTTA